MAVDLNKLAEKLKQQRNIGVARDGRLLDRDPRNDGNSNDPPSTGTTLNPKRFFKA
ncbi:MAG: hypothetical protein JRI79_13560 [Deltaproteobacteria bacterium]|nr:hypothetical protein [Deltaproteobacteria bacterium]MBW1978972.1 hypothetical protein [Deltaproteobacteria bacterium]MBW2044476.1 hypothetical protein [Deltaproteobacteria bacterium]